MKKLLVILSAVLVITACKKDDSSAIDKPYIPKGNLFYKLDGKIYDLNATLKFQGGVYRIFWDTNDASGSTYLNIDIYTNLEKTYTLVDSAYNTNHATFLYFAQNSGNNLDYYGKSGSLIVSEILDGKWSGTFSGIVKERATGKEMQLTEGKFTKLVQN